MKIPLALLLLLSYNFIGSSHPALLIISENSEIFDVRHEDVALPFLDEPLIDNHKYKQLLEQLEDQTYISPINASIDENGQIIPGQLGQQLNKKEFTEQFYKYFYGDTKKGIIIPTLNIHPRVDSELLANIRTRRIGQYITYFNKNNKERTTNISLAIEAIDNHVIFPGETFSFNKVVGKRTKEKGYLPAPIIIKGELSEGIGGGICQVSSTLFNAVDKAGVNILKRFSHSRNVRYVPKGRDATVSWYGPDFSFQNPYNQPLLLRAKVYGGQVMISVYSSDVINYEPREVPEASKFPFEETELDFDVDGHE